MPAFLSDSFTFWGIVAAQGRVRARSLAGSSPEKPQQRIRRASSCPRCGRHSRRHVTAIRKVMLQREKGKGSCAGCERFISVGQGSETWGLQRNFSGSSCRLRSSPPFQRAALFPGAAGAWAAGGLGLGTADELPRWRYYSSIFRYACQVRFGSPSLRGVMERLLGSGAQPGRGAEAAPMLKAGTDGCSGMDTLA